MRRTVAVSIVAVIVVIAVVAAYMVIPRSNAGATSATGAPNFISVSGLSLCSANCLYPSPYAEAELTVNASVPLSVLKIYVNGTMDTEEFPNPVTVTTYAYLWKGTVPSSLLPVVKGDTYVFKFIATFQTGSNSTVTASTVAT